MKRLWRRILLLLFVLNCFGCSNEIKETPYLSIAGTYYDDGNTPENGMTTAIYIKESDGKLKEIGSVPYTSQYPLAVYDRKEDKIYYTGSDESGKYDQLWQKDLKTNENMMLTDTMYAINYIVPRNNDIIIIGVARKERRIKPFCYNKRTAALREIETDIDFNCGLCAYDAKEDRLVLIGTSYEEAEQLREYWNENQTLDPVTQTYIPPVYYPPDTYFYEIDGEKANLVAKVESYEVKNAGIKGPDEITYSGYSVKQSDIPISHYSLKTGQKPDHSTLFAEDSSLYIYDEYVYEDENTIIFLGTKNEHRGIYRYNVNTQDTQLLYDGLEPHDAYINNFMLLR